MSETGPSPGQAADDALLDRLRAVATEVDPVPADVLSAAVRAFGMRMVDAELAELVADSLDSPHVVRGPSRRRLLAWVAGPVSVDAEISGSGETRRLVGIVEGAPGPVVLESAVRPDVPLTVDLDDGGRFTVDDVPAGLTRLRVTGPRAVVTAWTVI